MKSSYYRTFLVIVLTPDFVLTLAEHLHSYANAQYAKVLENILCELHADFGQGFWTIANTAT